MGAAIPLLMNTPRSCHLSVPPKASPGPVLVPMPCDDLREYRRDPATRQSPEVGISAWIAVWTALRLRENRHRGGIRGGCRRVRTRRGGGAGRARGLGGGGGGARGARRRGGGAGGLGGGVAGARGAGRVGGGGVAACGRIGRPLRRGRVGRRRRGVRRCGRGGGVGRGPRAAP